MGNKAVVIGAGITGLSAGWKLSEMGYSVKVFEQNNYIGGMSSTFIHKDYALDYGPHKIFTVMDNIMTEINQLFGPEELLMIKKKSSIRLRGRYLNYPVGMTEIFLGLGIPFGIKCGLGYFEALMRKTFLSTKDCSYEDWVVNRFGKPIYELILGPYANKIWGNPKQLAKDLAETRIAIPNLPEMIKQMIFGRKLNGPIISADVFYYPVGGFIEISNKMSSRIKETGGEVLCSKRLQSLNIGSMDGVTRLEFSDGTSENLGSQDVVISTIPLLALLENIDNPVEKWVKKAADKLGTRKLILLFVVINQNRVTNDNWIFFPENKYRFNRIFEQKGFNEGMIPKQKTVLCIEITCDESDPLWESNDEQVYSALLPDLKVTGFLENGVLEFFTKRLDNAYPVYDLDYKENLSIVINKLDSIPNLYSIGRQGGYSYAGMADCMDMGITTARFISSGNSRSEWSAFRQKFYNYVVVD